jgi:TRAP-type C4-dicarboxylate transport system permease small subunit
LLSDVITLSCCVLISIGAWKVIGLNLANIAPVSGIPLGIVFMACMLCSVGMGILLLGSIYRLLSGTMSEQEMCPDFDDAL